MAIEEDAKRFIEEQRLIALYCSAHERALYYLPSCKKRGVFGSGKPCGAC
jgi:hypothetical protein